MDISPNELAKQLDEEIETLRLLEGLFHLYDFKDRKLREVKSVNYTLINTLISDGIKTSKDYMLLCMSNDISSIAKKYYVDEKEAIKLFELCDLMRLPGVKDLRAALYHDCGYRRLIDFVEQNPDIMQQKITKVIAEEKINKSTPLRKEISTQIAVATVLPYILISGKD